MFESCSLLHHQIYLLLCVLPLGKHKLRVNLNKFNDLHGNQCKNTKQEKKHK